MRSPLKKSSLYAFLAIGALALASIGCHSIQKEEPVPKNAPSHYKNESQAPNASASSWRSLFESAELNALLERAEKNNLDLQAAWQSVLASQAIIRRVRSDRLPQANIGGSGERFNNADSLASDGSGESGERFDADLRAAWELDLFGRIRSNTRAAAANAAAEEALYKDLMFSLQADVASLYFQINSLQSEIEILERSRQTRAESLLLIEERLKAGTVSELAVAQTASLFATAESRLYALKRIQNGLLYSLAALLGETPSSFSLAPKALQANPPVAPSGLPSELLTRRPDIRRAEFQLEEASALLGAARADYFPRITLSGILGFASRDWDSLFNSGSEFDAYGPAVSLPIFQSGRLKASKAQAKANLERQRLLYRNAIIEAVTEVEILLQSIRLRAAQREAIARSVEATNNARRISDLQYKRGISDFITALDAERSALDAEQLSEQVRREQFIDTINLIRALGGSW
ncbi:MAG: efflux transporter outer membrane subunit [Verrucomicrobiota bacterium]